MKTLLIAVGILFTASSLSALSTEFKAMPTVDGYSDFQDTTKKKKDTTKKDTSLVQLRK